MNFITHNQRPLMGETAGTSLQGEIDCTYDTLCELFGEPMDGDGYKVDAEWIVLFDDGEVATIYNYKDGKNYCGDDGLETKQITDWHIGGMRKTVVDRVRILIDLHKEQIEESKPKGKVEETFQSCFEMMDTLRRTKGEDYAELVEIALLSKKRGELLSLTLGLMVGHMGFPEKAADAIGHMDAMLASRVIGKFAGKVEGFARDPNGAEEVIKWADKLMEQEQAAGESIIKDFMDKQKKGDS